MNNRIGKLVKDIQYSTDFTIEQIADKIDYSRAHLTRLAKHGDSKKAYDALLKEFGEITQKVQKPPVASLRAQGGQKTPTAVLDKPKDKLTSATKTPVFEMNSNGHTNDKDQTIRDQARAAIIHAEAANKNASTIDKLVDLLASKEKDK